MWIMDQPPPLAPIQEKKGMPTLAWVGIGCGGIILLGIILAVVMGSVVWDKVSDFAENPEKSLAQLVVRGNSDLEFVSDNEGAGEMTVRTKEGKTITLSYKEIAEGKLMVRDENGDTTLIDSEDLSSIPGWVPIPDDLTEGRSAFHSMKEGEISGQFSGKTAMDTTSLKDFYSSESMRLGLNNIRISEKQTNDTQNTSMVFSGAGKDLSIVISSDAKEGTRLTTTYSEKE